MSEAIPKTVLKQWATIKQAHLGMKNRGIEATTLRNAIERIDKKIELCSGPEKDNKKLIESIVQDIKLYFLFYTIIVIEILPAININIGVIEDMDDRQTRTLAL